MTKIFFTSQMFCLRNPWNTGMQSKSGICDHHLSHVTEYLEIAVGARQYAHTPSQAFNNLGPRALNPMQAGNGLCRARVPRATTVSVHQRKELKWC